MPIEEIVSIQRSFFEKGETKELEFRRLALKKLGMEIRLKEESIRQALYEDLGKADMEAFMSEIGLVQQELAFIARRLPWWMADKRVRTPIAHFKSHSFIRPEPYGVALIMSPWNYPFLLSMEPLIGAVAAGNCVVLKPSAYAPATSAVLRELIESCFAAKHVCVVEGGREENAALLEQRFDYIFFTGSTEVGRLVMEKAARNLTPISLELGGKSPCIVDETANLSVAGRRIAFGKFLNAGQTCVAPDYLLVQESVQEELLNEIQNAVLEFFGDDPLLNPELPKIINRKHFERLSGLLQSGRVYMGGKHDGECRIAPTVLTMVKETDAVMQEEIFGPILPAMTFQKLDDAISFVNSREKPLALYLFSTNKEAQEKVLTACSFGGGCINDTVVHLATSHMGFGGVGNSGMGSYHGKRSFDTFSHEKSILSKSNWPDLNIRYHPYSKMKEKLLRMVMK